MARGAVVLVLLLALAGCVSMPTGGPALSYPVTQGPSTQGQSYLQLIPKPPVHDGSPEEIVRGFLTASASFADGQRVAKEFLTPAASRTWKPTWSAVVFHGAGPRVGGRVPDAAHKGQVTVTVSGDVQAGLSGSGAYAVPSASGASTQKFGFRLAKYAGQWRIVDPPATRLLTSVEFHADYQLRNLYFLGLTSTILVPDPVYVPLETTPANLMNGLVHDLITPPGDWLSTATKSAFPRGTRLLSDVAVNGGAAEVNLGGAIAKVSDSVRELVSAQLLSTLSGSGQGQPLVRSVVLEVNGKAWSPPQAQDNPVQHSTSVKIPTGQSGQFYYLDQQGVVWSRSGTGGKPVKVQEIGTGFSAIAVSPDGQYLAALRHGQLFTGRIGTALIKRQGDGYGSVSWDHDDHVWATGAGGTVCTLAGAVTARSAAGPQAAPEPVDVIEPDGTPVSPPVTAVRIAPDGVRAAVVIGGDAPMLAFGAVVTQATEPGSQPRPNLMSPVTERINLAPFHVSGGRTGFSSVSWDGPDSVITVGAQPGPGGPTLTGYSVNGGQISTLPTQARIESVTASSGGELIAGATGGLLLAAPGTGGAWTPLGQGSLPTYPG